MDPIVVNAINEVLQCLDKKDDEIKILKHDLNTSKDKIEKLEEKVEGKIALIQKEKDEKVIYEKSSHCSLWKFLAEFFDRDTCSVE